jgi:hypothetical protein
MRYRAKEVAIQNYIFNHAEAIEHAFQLSHTYVACIIQENPEHCTLKLSPASSDLFNIDDLSRNIPSC